MLIEPLQGAPGSPAILGRRRMFTPDTHWIDTSRCRRADRFETAIAFPIGAKVIHIPEALAAMEAQAAEPDLARWRPTAAIFLAMDMEAVEMRITPGKQNLQDGMQVCQGHLAAHKHPTPDEWTNAA